MTAEVKLKWYWAFLILGCFVLSLVTLIPWYSVRANFSGYYSICPFVPLSTITMLAMSFALYAYARRHRKTFYRTALVLCTIFGLVLLTIFGFTVWWLYNFKLPMDSLEFSMAMRYFWIGTTSYYDDTEENASVIYFYLTIKNPTDRETPVFLIEPKDIAINNKKLISYYELDCSNGTSTTPDLQWFYHLTTLKPYENITLEIRWFVRYKTMEVETATREDVWASLLQRNFTFSMSGILTVRPYFNEGNYKPTWAARPFIVSQKYS